MQTFKTEREAQEHAAATGGVATARVPDPPRGVAYIVLYDSPNAFLEDLVRVMSGGGPRVPLPKPTQPQEQPKPPSEPPNP